MKSFRSLLSLIIISFLAGCTGSGEETLFATLPEQGWCYTDTLSFNPSPASGALYVAVRHDASYPYSNLWMEVAVENAGGRRSTDTVNITLCDPYGRWLGKGFGGSYQMELPVNQAVTIDSATTLRVRHIMRCDTIHGVDQVGIRLSAVD